MNAQTFYNLAVVQTTKSLQNLLKILEKGEAYAKQKNFEADVWLQMRLAPDQFSMLRQIQIACDAAKWGAFRSASLEPPAQADNEKTFEEAKARIRATLELLATLKASNFEGAAERRVTTPRWEGKTLSGEEFLVQHALPNVFFHVTTAYSILRANGVDVGKKDYLGELPFRAA